MPDVQADATGTNYFDSVYDMQYVIVRGPTVVEIKTSPLIVISFNIPAVTVDEFYGENLVNNLALFLGISADKIKVANAVSASGRRRKRSTNTVQYVVEISNPPANGTNTTVSSGKYVIYYLTHCDNCTGGIQ